METENYEMYGPIMIRNGFLRDSEGVWTNLEHIRGLSIRKMDIGKNPENWGIFFIEKDGTQNSSFLSDKNRHVAQQYLDHIINGGVIRYEDKIPVMAMK